MWIPGSLSARYELGVLEKQNSTGSRRDLHEAHVRGGGPNHQRRCRDGLHGSDRDVLSNGRWKDKTHPSSMTVDPRRHS